MSKSWTITATIDPTKLTGVHSGRFGASVFFCAFDHFWREWRLIYPGGEERIAQPDMILVDEAWTKANRTLKPLRVEKSFDMRRKKAEQLLLF